MPALMRVPVYVHVWACLQEYSSLEGWNSVCVFEKVRKCACFITRQTVFSPLFFSGLSEEQSFLFVSQSMFGEMIVGFRESMALFGKEQARIARFPFIIILLLSPLNILLYHLLSFCPFLPYFPSSLFPFLLFFSVLLIPTPSTYISSPILSSLCFPAPDWGGVLLVRQPMCLSVCVRER